MKITTWNVNSLRARQDHLLKWLEAEQPDVICLQELKLETHLFPTEVLAQAGYPHQLVWGQPTYNGVAILSRHPITEPQEGFRDGEPDPEARLLAGTTQGVRIYCCYVPNGRQVGSDHFRYKLAWVERLLAELNQHFVPGDDIAVCGDMNVALDDASVWDPFEMDGKVHYHPDEIERFQQLLDWGFCDSFREMNTFNTTFSWWNYQKGGWSRNHGLRIDHVFLTESLMDRCEEVVIHKDVRGWDQPSDHVPVVAILE